LDSAVKPQNDRKIGQVRINKENFCSGMAGINLNEIFQDNFLNKKKLLREITL